MTVDSTQRFQGFRRNVEISDEVWQTWSAHRQIDDAQPESFGVLIGWTSENRRELYVTTSTVPMQGDRQSRYHFLMQDPGHQAAIDREHKESGGTHIYLGTWHTHPQQVPSPSGVDKDDWRRCRKRNPRRSLLFAIVGTEATRLYVPWGCTFRALRERSEND